MSKPWELSDRRNKICIRPIRPEDEPLMGAFNRSISPHSIYLRYFHPISPTQLTSHEQLTSMCFIDFDREITLVAERKNENGQAEILAMGQLSKLIGSNDAEFALLVSDKYQRTGLGTELLSRCSISVAMRDWKTWSQRFCPKTRGCAESVPS
jgi:acetyltransferase